MSDLLAIRNEALSAGRAIAESVRLTDRVTVRRKTGQTTQDESTGREVPIWAVVHEDLPFRLDGSGNSDGGSHEVVIGGITYEQATAVGGFPASTGDLRDNDWFEVDSGDWPGAVFSIVAAIKADQKTTRRLPIAGQKRPPEWDDDDS